MSQPKPYNVEPAKDVILGVHTEMKNSRGEIAPGSFLLVVGVGDEVDNDVVVGDHIVVDPEAVFLFADFVAAPDADILAILKTSEPEACDCGECPGAADDDRCAIFDEADKETAYQDTLWGGPDSDDERTEDDWVRYITEYANNTGDAKARELPDGSNRDFRTRMVKVTALAIRAIESIDRQSKFLATEDHELNLAQEN